MVPDSPSREVLSLEKLLSEGIAQTFTPVLQSRDVWEVARALLQALHCQKTLTLLDPALNPELMETLEVDSEWVNPRIELPEKPFPQTLEDWRQRLESPSGGSLRLLSSGTTGKPTWWEHSLASLSRGIRRRKDLEDAVWGLCYPPSHMGGVQVLLQALFTGAGLVDLNELEGSGLEDLLRRIPVTHLSATPTFYRRLVQSGGPFPEVRQVTFGGDRFEEDIFQQLPKIFPNARFRNIYALTETGPLLVSTGEVFEIRPEQKDWLEIREKTLWVRRPGDITGTWISTGDQVEVLQKDPLQIRFTGRSQEVVNVAGLKVFLPEVEAVLQSHPQVREARVFAKPHPVSGKLLWAEVVAREPAPPESGLREFLRKKLPPAAIPRIIQFVESVTRTPSGKLQR